VQEEQSGVLPLFRVAQYITQSLSVLSMAMPLRAPFWAARDQIVADGANFFLTFRREAR
jgi:hypothetical protein